MSITLQEAMGATAQASALLTTTGNVSEDGDIDQAVMDPTHFEQAEEWRTRLNQDEQLLDDLPEDTRREALAVLGGEDDD
jgi:hypothetical protein